MRWLLHWILNAVALLIVAHFVEGSTSAALFRR